MNTIYIVNFKAKGHYGEHKTETHWVTFGPHRIAKIHDKDKYILPGGNIVDGLGVKAIAERNGWDFKIE
jgi:hypothetical protein